ncbi:hypothetical protein HU724_010360 [Pseudomonas iranensis]|uniref:hypothetical protein n=1 Tax=Pseudomonas iranensis TaxID=2745503 RepID=UPI0016457958|nr:hypothetical protein [Pseudomonas iranensis]QXI24651.1 hypothetical protein HU724_010360 [Pseudomonas iranensis]
MTAIKERPILFSAPMVRAILDGRKTVTRRPVKPQPEVRMVDMIGPMLTFKNKRGGHWLYPNAKQQIIEDCPFGKPGERLWVRETTEADQDRGDTVALSRYAADRAPVLYAGSEDPEYNGSVAHWDYPRRSRPSIHMPRWASRILLEITDVRVERLQDGEGETAFESRYVAEGINRIHQGDGEYAFHPFKSEPGPGSWTDPFDAWRELWVSVNGADSWNANPWVWVVEFKRVTP